MAQTPDGYLWLGSEFGLYRFDHPVPWQPPAGQQLPNKPYALLAARDGTLWIGTFEGLVSWNGAKLAYYPEIGKAFVTSLLEDRDGTVWVGTFSSTVLPARVCAIPIGSVQCKGEDGAFGSFVWSLGEDSSGTLWAGADSGVWRCNPGSPQRYAMPGTRVGDLLKSDDGGLLIGISGAGLKRLVADKVEPYPIYSAMNRNALLADREVDSNKLLRDRDGVSGLEPTNGGLSIYITAGQTYLQNPTDFRAISAAVSLRIAKAMFGSPAPGDWTVFESSPLLRFLRNRACPATIFPHWSQAQREAFGEGLTMV